MVRGKLPNLERSSGFEAGPSIDLELWCVCVP